MTDAPETDNKKYLMWSDGNVTSFGELISREGNTIKVKNPTFVIFDVSSVPRQDENGNMIMQKHLDYHVVPYVFPACIEKGEMIWDITPRHVFNPEAEFESTLLTIYNNVIRLAAHLDEGKAE